MLRMSISAGVIAKTPGQIEGEDFGEVGLVYHVRPRHNRHVHLFVASITTQQFTTTAPYHYTVYRPPEQHITRPAPPLHYLTTTAPYRNSTSSPPQHFITTPPHHHSALILYSLPAVPHRNGTSTSRHSTQSRSGKKYKAHSAFILLYTVNSVAYSIGRNLAS